MRLVIDDNEIQFTGKSDELYQDVAKLLVALENKDGLPVQKALKLIAVYALIIKSDLQ